MTCPTRRTRHTARKPLSTVQESRLIRHLDPALLNLSGSFESRHSPTSQLGDLAAFVDALVPLLSLVLAVPAAQPSGGLRVAYLLQLTGYLAPAIEGYPLDPDAFDKLFAVLNRFDRGWVAVLEGNEWDSANGTARNVENDAIQGGYDVQTLRNTDRVRLKSLVHDLRQVLASSFDLPQIVPLAINPFEQSLGVDVRARFGPDDDVACAPSTPELSIGATTDDDDGMSIDDIVEVTNTGGAQRGEEEEDDDDDDAEFEPVEIVVPPTHVSLASHTVLIHEESSYASPSSDSDDPPTAFEIHFNGPPPPTMTDGEITINSGETPIVAQRRGFDPDEEYPSESEDDKEGGEEGDASGGEGNGRREIREKVKAVFAMTRGILATFEGHEEG